MAQIHSVPEEGGEKKKGFMDKMFDAAKDFGKMTKDGVTLAGKFVVDKTKTAAKSIKV